MECYSPNSVACEKVKLMAVNRNSRHFIIEFRRISLCQGCDEIVQEFLMLGCLVAMSSRSNDHETTFIIVPVTLAPFASKEYA